MKSKLVTAKKSKTTIFSRVFHPQKIDDFLGKSKLNFWTKNEDFEQCALKEEKSHYGICNVKQQGNHHLLWLGNGEGGFSRTLWQSTYNNHTHVVYTLFKRLTIFRKACR